MSCCLFSKSRVVHLFIVGSEKCQFIQDDIKSKFSRFLKWHPDLLGWYVRLRDAQWTLRRQGTHANLWEIKSHYYAYGRIKRKNQNIVVSKSNIILRFTKRIFQSPPLSLSFSPLFYILLLKKHYTKLFACDACWRAFDRQAREQDSRAGQDSGSCPPKEQGRGPLPSTLSGKIILKKNKKNTFIKIKFSSDQFSSIQSSRRVPSVDNVFLKELTKYRSKNTPPKGVFLRNSW